MSDKNLVLRVFPLEKREAEEADPTLAGAFLPIGAAPFAVYQHRDGIRLAVMCQQEMGMRVWHPIKVAVADQLAEAPLGYTLGEPLGMIPIAGTPAALLPILPWPTHADSTN